MDKAGKVYLIGAGPGAPDLITIRGAELLKRSDIVFYDALVHPDTVALAGNAKKILVGKRCSQISTDQRFINRNLVEAAQRHGIVVRLKGGDPMLFGRAHEEIEALKQAGIEYEIVPGVTSALAAAAELGVSLTRRGMSRSVTFATSRIGRDEEASEWAQNISQGNTAVLYMGVGHAAEISEKLLAKGLAADTPVAVVESASLPGSRHFHCTLGELPSVAEWGVSGPALIMIGEVLREKLRAADTESNDSFYIYGASWFN